MATALQIQPGGVLILPTACVNDESASATSPLGITKTRHLHRVGSNFDLAASATPVAREEFVYRARSAATVKNFQAVLEESGTSVSITVDLKVYNAGNPAGVSILSAAVALVHGTGDWTAVAGTIASATLAAGDMLAIALAVSSSTGATGIWADLEIDEPSA